ncbi:MAG TPA: hypothetical protein VHA78_03880 [Candidatus Peribacteraceae bacterium]|nr:hypothetical protein [Candidatus Peribacteraceae bacterium]
MKPQKKTLRQALFVRFLLAMSSIGSFAVLPRAFAATQTSPFDPGANPNLPLLAPIDPNVKSLPPSSNGEIFFVYFNMAWPWILGCAAGIGVLQALIGGIEIMLSGSDSAMRDNGKNKIQWALAGLLMVGFATLILKTLNSTFYV